MARTASTTLEALVEWGEVVTSGEIIRRMIERQGGSHIAARKRLERAADSPKVWRSNALVLPKNTRLFARRGFLREADFYREVAKSLEQTRPGFARCLRQLGVQICLHEAHVRKLLAAPVEAGNAFPGLERDLEALRELGLILHQSGSHRYIGRNLSDKDSSELETLFVDSLDVLRRENLLARVLVNRLRKQNLLSWNGSSVPAHNEHGVDFNDQLFTATGFSYLAPLVKVKQETGRLNPCPVLIDICSGECGKHHVESFINRAERATLRKQKGHRYLGVIAGRSFNPEAWHLAKSRGLMAINLVQMFGDDALEAMAIAERLLGGFLVQPATKDFTDLLKSIELLKTNPVVVDLYSIGFEAFAGLALRDDGYEDVTLNTLVPYRETKRDVDVHGKRKDELVVIECKAYHGKKSLSSMEVNKFFTETMPSFVKWWMERNGNRQPKVVRAEIWTTGRVGKEADTKLGELKLKPNIQAKIYGKTQLEKTLSFEIKTRMTQLLSAIERGGDSDETES